MTTLEDGTIDLSKLPAGAAVVTELECPGYVIDDAQRIILFLHQESTRFLIGEDDLPQGIGLEIAQQLAIPPNGKGDVNFTCSAKTPPKMSL